MPVEIREIVIKSTVLGTQQEQNPFESSNPDLERFKSEITNEILEKVERILERNKER